MVAIVRRYESISRRAFIADLGRATLGIVILGAAACASDDEPSSQATSSPRRTTGPGGDLGGWERVNLGQVSAFILVRAGESVIVDTGVAGSEDEIERALSEAGSRWAEVGHVILTHKHPDHVGSAEQVLTRASEATAYAGAADIPAIDVSREVTSVGDGDEVAGLKIIETPGHTPGHVAVHDPKGRVFVAGDSMVGSDGGVGLPPAQYTEDMNTAKMSIAKVGELDFDVALFGHGDPLTSNASTRVAVLAEEN